VIVKTTKLYQYLLNWTFVNYGGLVIQFNVTTFVLLWHKKNRK